MVTESGVLISIESQHDDKEEMLLIAVILAFMLISTPDSITWLIYWQLLCMLAGSLVALVLLHSFSSFGEVQHKIRQRFVLHAYA